MLASLTTPLERAGLYSPVSADGGHVPGEDAGAGELPGRSDRLVRSPVFVLSSLRSGSTLLRVLLNSHSGVHAPHELHLRTLRVQVPKAFGEPSMAALGLDQRELEHLLWDRLLDRELRRSGKSVIVDKTPANVFMWERIVECWPAARFIVLLRHPAAIVDSLARARPEMPIEKVEREVLGYAVAVETAREQLTTHLVRYETLVASPAIVLRDLCACLGIAWEPTMLEYGRFDHGAMRAGLGDWGERIRSGRIHEPRHLPAAALFSSELRTLVHAWGYPLGGETASTDS
jgi:hypothetical protein